MSMTIQSSVKDKILATSSEMSKVENAPAEMLRDLDQQMEKRADDGKANVVTGALSRKERVKPRRARAMAMTIQYGVRGMILTAQSEAFKQENGMMRTVVMDEAHASRSHVLWVEIGESSLIGLELVQETTDKVVLIKEKLKAARDHPKELCWIGLVADRLRLPEELSCVHDTFHVSNLEKKCLADASLHMPLDEIKVDKTLRFVEEPVENSDREVKRLVKPLVLTYESVVMYGLCVYMRYVDYVRVGNQSIERDRLIGIGLVMDLVKFLSFTFGGKEMTFVVLAFLR
ncbi:hypothetical protein Tco_1430621 [Tanacetum coccineum]